MRRTRAGDAWDAADAASCGVPAAPGSSAAQKGKASLGMPTLRVSDTRVSTIPIYPHNDEQR